MSLKTTTKLSGSASEVIVGKVAHGIMSMTWRAQPVSDEEAFESLKASIDAAYALGVKMIVNSAEFYANDLGTGSLELLSRFFEKHPEYADRTFLSVKGGSLPQAFGIDNSPENLRRSVNAVNAALRGKKRVDLFESARVDPKIPIEDVMTTMKSLVAEGLFDHIGISECSAETLRRAAAVAPIAAAEIEVSPWSYEEETKKVLVTAQELDIAVIAYSPLGRGYLTGTIKSPEDIPEGDMRRNFTRFREEYFMVNYAIVEALKAISEKKKITSAQLCIAWVATLGEKVIPLPGSSNVKRTLENIGGGNVELTKEEKAEIQKIIETFEVKGDRYTGMDPKVLHLWG
ncbi:unnamed protein product [Somion occarium]|uniref:NADP-dependent oxidoreductase domain-containing protein n=1 Tax=Somion occarium TaxID=3059160 RepID=A0ABP1DB80_9APHY